MSSVTNTSPDRHQFRDILAQCAAQAKTLLPAETNGRLESAIRLVLAQDVTFLPDGTAEVGSASDAMKTYAVTAGACDCQDFACGKAPAGMCQHRIAANLQRSVERVLAQRAPAPVEPDGEPWPEMDPESAGVAAQPTTTAAPQLPALGATVRATVAASQPAPALPEAAFSLTLKGHLDGIEALFTVRGQTAAEFQANLAAVRGLLDQPPPPAQPPARQEQGLSAQQHNAAAMHRPTSGFCAVHNVDMKLNHGKDGRAWYSHWDEASGRWCKGK